MEAIPPSIPFVQASRVANAYGVRPPQRVQPAAPVQPAQAVGAADATGTKTDPRMGRLVAATVPGGVSFEGGVPTPTQAAIPFYRHPADANAAATGVNLGRVLDTNG